MMGGVDKVVTHQLDKRMQRKGKECERNSQTTEPMPSTSGTSTHKDGQETVSSAESNSDEEFLCHGFETPKIIEIETCAKKQTRTFLTNTAKAADLTGASNRTVAKIANAVLADLNVISKGNTSKVVDKNKVRRGVM